MNNLALWGGRQKVLIVEMIEEGEMEDEKWREKHHKDSEELMRC